MKRTLRFGLRHTEIAAGALAAIATAGGLVGCGSGDRVGATGNGQSVGGVPPPPPSAGPPRAKAAHNYAMRQLFLGDADRNGVFTVTAWKGLGYNLDDKITTAESTDVCTLAPGSSAQTQVDGNGGIDNAFGAEILPILQVFDSSVSLGVNASIEAGGFTMMTYVAGFDDADGNTTSATGLTGALLAAGAYAADGAAPSWNTSTVWPVLPDPAFLRDCSATEGCPASTDAVTNATIAFGAAYQTRGTFVSGPLAPLTLLLRLGGEPLYLQIASGVLSFDRSSPGSVTNGTIAGVLKTQDLITGLMGVAGAVSLDLCTGSRFDAVSGLIRQASDIVFDGDTATISNGPGTACNAISIGLGFNATEIAAPTSIASNEPPWPNVCTDGG